MKRILWLQTGGTINCLKTDSGLTPAAKADINITVGGVTYDTEAVFTLDSADITPRHWQLLAGRITGADAGCGGFVITHGTDTLEYSAAALSLMLADFGKPVVFTGAIIPPHETDSDALPNLTTAFEAARDMQNGVFVAFAGKIINGISCMKVHTKDKDAFTDAGLTYECRGAHCASVHASYEICEKVFLLKITPDMNGGIADFLLEKGYRGVVCEGFGLGGIPSGLLARLGELVKRGVRVVTVSQCLYGGADLNVYAAHRKALSLGLEAWSMTPAAAFVRLMLEIGGEKHGC
jgi:L-asparaginase